MEAWQTNKDYIKKYDNAERRFFSVPGEIRAKEENMIEGIAAKVGVTYDLGWFDERIEAGAFDEVLEDDVRALFNHDPNLVLGRTSSGTLSISTDDDGNLTYSYKTPKRSYAQDLEDAIQTGDVNQSSFAFTVKDDEWRTEDERELRVIKKIGRLYDVSPVTYPANADTSVAKRSKQRIEEIEKEKIIEEQKKKQLFKDCEDRLSVISKRLKFIKK